MNNMTPERLEQFRELANAGENFSSAEVDELIDEIDHLRANIPLPRVLFDYLKL
jgi:hypothetical protein